MSGVERVPLLYKRTLMLSVLDQQIGERVRGLRQRNKIDAGVVATACGISVDDYLNSEIGARQFSPIELLHITECLHVPIGAIFGNANKVQ